MGLEIERKFIVVDDSWRNESSEGVEIVQGYFFAEDSKSLRLRITSSDAVLALKLGDSATSRLEFEFPVCQSDAADMLAALGDAPFIRKTRFVVPAPSGLDWEVDVFQGALAGLTIAEIELPDVTYILNLPAWVGKEVTADKRFLNQNLLNLTLEALSDLL